VKKSPNGKSVGTDDVFAEGLRKTPDLVAHLLAELRQACGRLAYMPRVWQVAVIIPMHKKGDTDQPQNYRPIAIISQLRKIIDKALEINLRRA